MRSRDTFTPASDVWSVIESWWGAEEPSSRDIHHSFTPVAHDRMLRHTSHRSRAENSTGFHKFQIVEFVLPLYLQSDGMKYSLMVVDENEYDDSRSAKGREAYN